MLTALPLLWDACRSWRPWRLVRLWQFFCPFAGLSFCLAVICPTRSEVRITDAEDEGVAAYKIETSSATYFLQKEAGGFSTILDKDGNDWVQFRSEPDADYPAGAASQFRGLPNLVYGGDDNGVGHPGFAKCTSVLVDDHTIRSTSKSGKWQWTWTFTETDAKLHVESVDPDIEIAALNRGLQGLGCASQFLVRSA